MHSFSKLGVRYFGISVGVATGITAAQVIYIERTYQPLPVPYGATNGVALAPKSSKRNKTLHEVLDSAEKEGKCKKNIICAGDSLVAGVGCVEEEAVFSRHIAGRIAEHFEEDVMWHSFADNGSDVNQLQVKLGPDFDNYCLKNKAGKVDAVVLMCGLNDWKRIANGNKTPEIFYRDLREMVKGIHDRFGNECHVILPALPIHWTTAFPQPLKTIILFLSEVWDNEKKRLAQESKGFKLFKPNSMSSFNNVKNGSISDAENYTTLVLDAREGDYEGYVHFIEIPPGWPPDVQARDGVHPNERGYRVWGDHIAQGVNAILRGNTTTARSTSTATTVEKVITSDQNTSLEASPHISHFQEAAKHASSKQFPKVSNAQRLELYGLYKQATESRSFPNQLNQATTTSSGRPSSNKERPSVFDPVARAKFDAWNACKMYTQDESMLKYIELVRSIDANWGGSLEK